MLEGICFAHYSSHKHLNHRPSLKNGSSFTNVECVPMKDRSISNTFSKLIELDHADSRSMCFNTLLII